MKRRAFTLVELLVVIAIIGLLSTVALVSTNSARVKTRNAKRIADARQLANAFYLAATNSSSAYPSSGSVPVCISTACTGTWESFLPNETVNGFIAPYMAGLLTDPADASRGAGGYVYDTSWPGGNGVDGYFPPDTHISYVLEGAVSCAPGRIFWQNSSRTQCLLTLDPL